jgi:hypothetical protein
MTQGPTMTQLNKYKNTWINLHKGKWSSLRRWTNINNSV